jgi:glycosyltransferase involved in cell wall biosynthesis
VRIAAARPDARFLVVGSKRLPDEARAHALVRSGLLLHRPKSRRPEPWFAALDLFLYPARFEEFGLVLAEAQAMGVPVLTSRRVGASECLPAAYAPWLLDAPDVAALADRAVALLADASLRAGLARAAAQTVVAFDERAYVDGTRRLIAAQNPRLK